MRQHDVDHFYEFGDVYETLSTCDALEMKLGRLKRQRVLDEVEWVHTTREVESIRASLERRLEEGLKPRGPRLP